jgi:hypothetical protein
VNESLGPPNSLSQPLIYRCVIKLEKSTAKMLSYCSWRDWSRRSWKLLRLRFKMILPNSFPIPCVP